MAAPTKIYVDPSINADSGAGTSGDPYGDLEYAIEQTTFDTTNGTEVNIKSGATETLAADLSTAMADTVTTAAWVSSLTAPVIFRGYTTTSGDGGIGVVSGGNSVSIFTDVASTGNYIVFADLRLTDTAANAILSFNDFCSVINCRLDTSSGIAIDGDNAMRVVNCYIHDCTGTYAVYASGQKPFIYGNIITSGVTTAGIQTSTDGRVIQNIVKLTTTNGADGIRWGDNSDILNNSVFATAGTGSGFVGSGAGRDGMAILNNIAEGFSGAGGDGYDFSATDHAYLWGYNAAYNNTNNENKATGEIMVDIGGDDIPLSASAFTDPSTNDFSVGTEVKATAMPNFVGGGTTPGTTQYLDMGAAQRQEAAAAGGGAVPVITGG